MERFPSRLLQMLYLFLAFVVQIGIPNDDLCKMPPGVSDGLNCMFWHPESLLVVLGMFSVSLQIMSFFYFFALLSCKLCCSPCIPRNANNKYHQQTFMHHTPQHLIVPTTDRRDLP